MCGLCGILNLDGAPVPRAVLDAMNATLIHRGPDQGAAVINGACGLANRRLAILDLSPNAALPMQSADGVITLAYNGEVYNYPDLRRTLETQGHVFRSGSDAEAVIALYRQHGPGFLDHLRGMFALALWDDSTHTLILARDRMGQKPLYYYQDGRRLIFASEIKALLMHPNVPRRPAYALAPLALAYGYVPAPLTFFEGIRMLPPGHVLICRDGAITTRAYWTPPAFPGADPSARAEDYLDELRATLEEAVRLRLLSDVPLGAFLSGGLDSSLIVAYMARHTSGQVKTFAIGFTGEASYDETAHARRVATLLDTDHHEFIVEPDAISLLPLLVWHHDQPFADSSAIPTYLVSKLTREHVTVALTGDGGDELFAGYERFHAAALAARYRRLPGMVRAGIRAGVGLLPDATSYRGVAQRARRFVLGADMAPADAYFSWVRLFDDGWIADLLPDGAGDPTPTAHFAALFDPADRRDLTAQLLDVNLTTYLPDDLLIKTDRASMAPSLEARAPFLDHVLVELAARIPSNLKLHGGVTKAILKQAAVGLLPDDIIHRKKHGFGVPVGRWFREGLPDYAREILLDPGTLARGIFHKSAVQRMLDEHTSGGRNHGQRIWTLLTFEWWHRLFFDPDIPTAPTEDS
ncbi:MAG: asparagine synthase (glutamine-hydrolyzing) [Anaerolineae bacterium]|nr:asparagine synthase (glutamine-hydrolyzing) [Anaerolineae bacterium]